MAPPNTLGDDMSVGGLLLSDPGPPRLPQGWLLAAPPERLPWLRQTSPLSSPAQWQFEHACTVSHTQLRPTRGRGMKFMLGVGVWLLSGCFHETLVNPLQQNGPPYAEMRGVEELRCIENPACSCQGHRKCLHLDSCQGPQQDEVSMRHCATGRLSIW